MGCFSENRAESVENQFAIKYDFKKGPEVSYNNLITSNSIEMISLADFLLGLPVSDAGTYIKDDLYRDKNFLVLL